MIDNDLRAFGARRYFEVDQVVKNLRVKDIGTNILIAVGTRESNLQNALNQAGTDRGVWQINAIHDEWLKSYPGCLEGTWNPVAGKTAFDAGFVPTLKDGAFMAYSLLRNALVEGRKVSKQPVRFALAAFNAGVGGAKKGLAEGDVDKYTTGGNYSIDVLEVRYPLVKSWVESFGWF